MSMPNPTPAAEVAALAELVGITPETHKHFFKLRLHCCECGSESRLAHGSTWVCSNGSCPAFDYGFSGAKGYKQAQRLVANLPDPLGPDADGVWAVPIMYWLRDNAREPTVCEYPRGWKAYVMNDESEHIRGYAATMTAALLQACLAARVPEVCKIMEANHD